MLAGLVAVRTFLSWTLVLEIEGRWPWQGEPSRAGDPSGVGMTGPRAYVPRRQGAEIVTCSGLPSAPGTQAASG